MRKVRLVVLLALLCSLAVTLPTSAFCPATPDGYVVCNARCVYPHSCAVGGGGGYCYYDVVVNTCFDGGYDRCCRAGSLF